MENCWLRWRRWSAIQPWHAACYLNSRQLMLKGKCSGSVGAAGGAPQSVLGPILLNNFVKCLVPKARADYGSMLEVGVRGGWSILQGKLAEPGSPELWKYTLTPCKGETSCVCWGVSPLEWGCNAQVLVQPLLWPWGHHCHSVLWVTLHWLCTVTTALWQNGESNKNEIREKNFEMLNTLHLVSTFSKTKIRLLGNSFNSKKKRKIDKSPVLLQCLFPANSFN